MTVRAKFKIDSLTRVVSTVPVGVDDQGKTIWGPGEVVTIKGSPVYGSGDPNHENTKFWQSSPSGSVELGTVNMKAAEYFELGKEYYVDFTKAEK